MDRILVATDFSTRSDRAVQRAVLLAKQYSARIFLVHVIDDDQRQRIIRAEHTAVSELLEETASTLRSFDRLKCVPKVVLGDPFQGIVATAQDVKADIIVIGPHRRQVLKDIFVGTTAERTIRTSGCPVIMANAPASSVNHHMLLTVDMSEASKVAFKEVYRLGLDTNMRVTVMYVFDAPAEGLMSRYSVGQSGIESYLNEEAERASADLTAFLDQTEAQHASCIVRVADGSVANTITAAAEELAADLVVLASRGRGGTAKKLLGSVAEGVLRVSACDVLIVPPSG